MNEKFTPGPWVVDADFYVYGGDGRKNQGEYFDGVEFPLVCDVESDSRDRTENKATAALIALLEKAGIFPGEVTCSGQASKLLDTIAKRRAEGLTTPKQIRFLERVGFRNVGQWQFNTAQRLLDRIAGNGWRVPAGINPQYYRP